MFAPRMQDCVKEALETALRQCRAGDVEQGDARNTYYCMKRSPDICTMIDVLNEMYWSMNFGTYLAFIQILARKLESNSEVELKDYYRNKRVKN